jgi:hypothetical protein
VQPAKVEMEKASSHRQGVTTSTAPKKMEKRQELRIAVLKNNLKKQLEEEAS